MNYGSFRTLSIDEIGGEAANDQRCSHSICEVWMFRWFLSNKWIYVAEFPAPWRMQTIVPSETLGNCPSRRPYTNNYAWLAEFQKYCTFCLTASREGQVWRLGWPINRNRLTQKISSYLTLCMSQVWKASSPTEASSGSFRRSWLPEWLVLWTLSSESGARPAGRTRPPCCRPRMKSSAVRCSSCDASAYTLNWVLQRVMWFLFPYGWFFCLFSPSSWTASPRERRWANSGCSLRKLWQSN